MFINKIYIFLKKKHKYIKNIYLKIYIFIKIFKNYLK